MYEGPKGYDSKKKVEELAVVCKGIIARQLRRDKSNNIDQYKV